MSTTSFTVRRAEPRDLSGIGPYAAALVRLHHQFDADRFFLPEYVESGYVRFLRTAMRDPEVVVLVAEEEGRLIGYSFGKKEPRDWNALLDACGALHDLYVDPSARGRGVGEALVTQTANALRSLGAERIVLHTASANEAARKLFEKLGFRSTMIEMTLSLGSPTESGPPASRSP